MIDAEYHGLRGVLSTYVIIGGRSMVIDPGPTASTQGVIRGLKQLGLEDDSITHVAPTHIHLDHAGGSWSILEQFRRAKLYVHPRGAKHMVDPEQLEAASRQLFGERVDGYGEIKGIPAEKVMNSKDGQVIELDGVEVHVIWTPGHASHHQCYYIPDEEVVVLGDAGGFYNEKSNTIMPTTPPPFNPSKAVQSLEKLISLEPKIVCYGHFGFAEWGVEKLNAHMEQILLWSNIIEEGIKKHLSHEQLYAHIRREDYMAKKAGEFNSNRRERSSYVNIDGFIEYFKWKKERETR
jgi:hydroxyacylglutathione hydrolase